MMSLAFKGKVFSGSREGKKFIELPWVREQIKEKLGFEPYPGTLNLADADMHIIKALGVFRGFKIAAKEGYFSGRLYKALINRKISGGIIRPDVPGYQERNIEVIAPLFLREEFNLRDGDEVEIRVLLE